MLSTIHALNNFLPFSYLVVFVLYLFAFFKENKSVANAGRVLLLVTLLVHVFYLLARTIEFNHTPITNKFEIFSVLAFCISVTYFTLELLTEVRATGMFLIIFSVLFQIISSLFIQDLLEVKEVLRNRMLGMHVIAALGGYAGMTISAVYGVLYILRYKDIKNRQYNIVFKRLPSLEVMEKLSYNSLVIGFILLVIAAKIGLIWLPSAFPDFSYSDPKLISVFLVVIVYAIGIISKMTGYFYGKKVIWFSLIGFGIAMFSLLLSNLVADSFHTFY